MPITLPDDPRAELDRWAAGIGDIADGCAHCALGLALSLVGACLAAVGVAHVVARLV